MKRTVLRLGLAGFLVGLGWVAGRAQTTQPDFELVVTAPSGTTDVECVRGCGLLWAERSVSSSTPQQKFTFGCSNTERCSSARIGGWVKR
jgi:hypothetical protein